MKTIVGKPHSSKEYRDVTFMWQQGPRPSNTAIESVLFLNPSLLSVLDQSPCVTWILDIRTQTFSFITNNTTDFFGYEKDQYVNGGQSFHERIKHPDDRISTGKLLFQIWNTLAIIPSATKANYKFSYDYRIVKPDGKVVRILEQNAVLQQDADGTITHLLGMCNDITQWKKGGSQLASLTSTADRQHFLFTSDNTSMVRPKGTLSKRELEILKLMSEGHNSKFIADKLCISFHTVNTHRQKMIGKTNTRNTGSLIQFAICNGLI
jgi:DNA-binding CsgD family transcriptional regulator